MAVNKEYILVALCPTKLKIEDNLVWHLSVMMGVRDELSLAGHHTWTECSSRPALMISAWLTVTAIATIAPCSVAASCEAISLSREKYLENWVIWNGNITVPRRHDDHRATTTDHDGCPGLSSGQDGVADTRQESWSWCENKSISCWSLRIRYALS